MLFKYSVIEKEKRNLYISAYKYQKAGLTKKIQINDHTLHCKHQTQEVSD